MYKVVKRSKCKSWCRFFSKKGGDISIGYNGFPMGVEDLVERLDDPELKLELIIHAEQNALIAVGSRTQGPTIYVWGKPICARYTGIIIQAGVKRIAALSPDSVGEESKWYKTGQYSKKMFDETDVKTDLFVVKSK